MATLIKGLTDGSSCPYKSSTIDASKLLDSSSLAKLEKYFGKKISLKRLYSSDNYNCDGKAWHEATANKKNILSVILTTAGKLSGTF